MTDAFILIPGRTSRQGVGISEGKFQQNYRDEIRKLQMTPGDMERLGISSGDTVRVASQFGQVEMTVTPSKGDELPDGLLFMAYGDLSSQLMGGDTHGSGMPTSKGLDVSVALVK